MCFFTGSNHNLSVPPPSSGAPSSALTRYSAKVSFSCADSVWAVVYPLPLYLFCLWLVLDSTDATLGASDIRVGPSSNSPLTKPSSHFCSCSSTTPSAQALTTFPRWKSKCSLCYRCLLCCVDDVCLGIVSVKLMTSSFVWSTLSSLAYCTPYRAMMTFLVGFAPLAFSSTAHSASLRILRKKVSDLVSTHGTRSNGAVFSLMPLDFDLSSSAMTSLPMLLELGADVIILWCVFVISPISICICAYSSIFSRMLLVCWLLFVTAQPIFVLFITRSQIRL